MRWAASPTKPWPSTDPAALVPSILTSSELPDDQRFRTAFGRLAASVQGRARRAYRLFQRDPSHPSLRFKLAHPSRPIYSVRISLGYRALGVRDKDNIIWFWIGSHADYDQLLQDLPREAGR